MMAPTFALVSFISLKLVFRSIFFIKIILLNVTNSRWIEKGVVGELDLGGFGNTDLNIKEGEVNEGRDSGEMERLIAVLKSKQALNQCNIF